MCDNHRCAVCDKPLSWDNIAGYTLADEPLCQEHAESPPEPSDTIEDD